MNTIYALDKATLVSDNVSNSSSDYVYTEGKDIVDLIVDDNDSDYEYNEDNDFETEDDDLESRFSASDLLKKLTPFPLLSYKTTGENNSVTRLYDPRSKMNS